MRLLLSSLHPRVLSGQIDSLAGLGRALTRRGHDVELVTTFDASDLLSASLVDLDAGPRGLAHGAAAMFRTIPRIVRAARGADLVHLALPTPAFACLGDIVQHAAAVPVVVGFEGHLVGSSAIASAAARRPSALASAIPQYVVNNRLVARLGARLSPRYVVSSRVQRDELLGLGFASERVAVLPNLVEDGKLTACDPAIARRRLGLPQGMPLVGYLGHFNDVKGVDVLADGFAELVRGGSDAHLALAWSGQGDDAPIRRRLAPYGDRVHWLEKVHVGTFLCAIDVLALPYRSTAGQGAYPSLVLEAIQAGCPLVTTDLPMLREIAALGGIASTCPPEDPPALAARIDELLASGEVRRRMRDEQARVAREHFAADVLAERYEGLYRAARRDTDRIRLAA